MSPKQQFLELVGQLPDDCSLADIEYQFHILCKVQRSEDAVPRGEVLSMEEASPK